MGTSDDVERIAAPVLQAAGLELIDVELRSGNIVVTVDREGGIDLDTLAVGEQGDLGRARPRERRAGEPLRARGLEPRSGAPAPPA